MGYAIVSEAADPLLRFATITAAGAGVLIVLLLLAILLLRASRMLSKWRGRRFADHWRPLLARCAVAAPETFPHLRRRDRFAFLALWNHYYELLRGESLQNLRVFAIGVNIRPFLQRKLHGFSVRGRLIAATTLGHLRAPAAMPELERLSRSRSAPLSFAAARALLEIDPVAHLPQLLLTIAARHDWPLSKIALALNDLGADHFSAPLANAAVQAARRSNTLPGMPRLLHLMELAHNAQVMPAIDRLLRRADELGPRIIAPCLRLLNDPREAHWARKFATHGTWYVRVTAANALRRIGDIEDRERLMHMLCDEYWWVRYRAAQALATLPGVTLEELAQIGETHSDRFAADILHHVIAEARLS